MLDLSRNGVMRAESMKEYMEYMAVMGLNTLVLYMEDVYEIPGRPYFGYMRGRYSAKELTELDEYGQMLGIELYPHIQTLGHMAQYIKWDEALPMRDMANILLADEERTYELIEDMIKTVSASFKSRKIHLGMDEAGLLGCGNYFAKHGFVPRIEILLRHLRRVTDIAEKYGLQPAMYSDILFASLSGNEYFNTAVEIPKEVADRLPECVTLNSWGYDSVDGAEYDKTFKLHKALNREVMFTGGIWNWFGFCPDNFHTLETGTPALTACKRNGINRVLGSVWGDDGCESNHFFSVMGMQLYAEHMYNSEVSEEQLRERFEFCTGADYGAFLEISEFHSKLSAGDRIEPYWERYYGKRFFWQDILIGLLDSRLYETPMDEHYNGLYERMQGFANKNTAWSDYFAYTAALCDILRLKCYISQELRPRYLSGDKEFLAECARTLLPDLLNRVRRAKSLHKKQWLKTYKPFGWEVLDIRYSGLAGRIEYATERLEDYISGSVSALEELDAVRLPHSTEWHLNYYHGIATACLTI